MTKRDFVQQYVLRWFDRTRTNEPGMTRLIYEGERLWAHISKHGYGASQERGPREHVDWYSPMSDEQRAYFDRFWKAFNLKRGKQRAAMRWQQICPDPETAEYIIVAAAAEAERKLPEGQVRKMAEGWLAERRWEDYPAPAAQAETTHRQQDRAERARLAGEIIHLDQMIARHTSHGNTDIAQQLLEQADDLRGRLAVLEAERA